MQIVKLVAENVKRLKVVEITPDGHTVVVAGRNAQGKTSVLDAMFLALGGGAASKALSKPVRDGEDTAEVVVDLGELVVTRRWTAGGENTSLKVTTAEGFKAQSPQKVLDELIGRMAFDPLAFVNAKDADQVATLLELIDLPFDPGVLGAERRELFEARTVVNREVKAMEARVAGMAEPPEGTPEVEQSMADALSELDEARTHNDRLERLGLAAADADVRVDEAVRRVDALRIQLVEAEAAHAVAAAEAEAARTEMEEAPDPVDVEAISDRLRSLEVTNRHVRDGQARRAAVTELARVTAESESLTDEITKIDRRRKQAIAAAAMPIDGLSFTDDEVLYRDQPLKQASSAEQLRVSVAMAMAMNPKIRVLRITDGSLLDTENMALIAEMAEAHDFQVWVEVVSDGDGPAGAVVIEDGEVKEGGVL